jgi:hypothetical protein
MGSKKIKGALGLKGRDFQSRRKGLPEINRGFSRGRAANSATIF